MIKMRNLDFDLQAMIRNAESLIPGAADKHLVCKQSSSTAYQPYTFWRDKVENAKMHASLAAAHAACVSGRNDVVLLSPDSHNLSETLTWSKNLTHLIGMFGPAMLNHRSRIGAGAAITPMVDITGYGNTFANLYIMWGYDNVASTIGVRITGDRNNFHRVHFAGPMNDSHADTANNTCCSIYGAEECYFNHCVFGTDTIERGADVLSLLLDGAGGADVAMRHIFDNCIFLSSCDAGADAHFIHATVNTHGWALFRKCQFINISAAGFGVNTMALGLSSANGTDFRFILDGDCSFHGVTDVIAHGEEAKVEFGVGAVPATAVDFGLFMNPDHTA